MIGRTLSLYISLKFIKILLAMFFGLAFLVSTVDFVEQLRRFANFDEIAVSDFYMLAVFRTPSFLEKAFPFACLFAAMITLTQLNTKMELVVARASGVSAWQFLLPISVSAALVGIVVATVYNPVSIAAFEKSVALEAKLLKRKTPDKKTIKGHWIKQDDGDGNSIIHAQLARNGGKRLDKVKIIRFDEGGKIRARLDAVTANYNQTHWALSDVRITNSDGRTRQVESMNLPTRLTADALLGASTAPESVNFWELSDVAERLEKSGIDPKPYLVQFHSLTALPLLLVAMVLVASTVCLRFVRFGQFGRMIFGGILAGFVLYTITKLVTALGSNGVVPPAVAAWAPAFVAILFGMSILLHQEDG